jgi:hypothetical protein
MWPIDGTFIGAVRLDTVHACPQIPDIPKGIIF